MTSPVLKSGFVLFAAFALAGSVYAQKNSDAAATDKTAIQPVKPENLQKAPTVPETVAPTTKPLPPELITTSLSGKEVEFLMTSFENGRVIAWLAEVAKSKAANEQLRTLGGTLARMQAEENDTLRTLARSKGLKVKEGAPPVQQSKIQDELPQETGERFDRALLPHIMEAVEKSVSLYEEGAKSEDADIRKRSEQLLPAAREELEAVRKLKGA